MRPRVLPLITDPVRACLLVSALGLTLAAQGSKSGPVEVESHAENSRRNVEDGEKSGASRGGSHVWGPEGSESYKFRRATDNYYEVTEDVTLSHPSAKGYSRVTRTRVYFLEPGTGDYMRYETWVYYDAKGEPAVVKGSTEGNMKLWTKMRAERDKGEKQLDEDLGKLDEATGGEASGGGQAGGGAGDAAGASNGGSSGGGSGGTAAEKGAANAAKVLVERWGERTRFELLIHGILGRYVDGARLGKPDLLASAWANLPGKRAQARAMASREATKDQAIHAFSPMEWDEAGRVEISAWARRVDDEGGTMAFRHDALLIPYLGEWGLWTLAVMPEE
jgi:hypothetical protein